MTREQIYRQQLTELGIYNPAFDPEIKTLAQLERRLTRVQKAWSETAPSGGKPSFLDDHYPIIVQLEDKILAHREALGLTPKSLRRLIGVAGSDTPQQQDMITAKLDQIAARVAGYDNAADIPEDPFEDLPGAAEAAAFSEKIDEDLRKAIAEDMG